MRSRSQTMHAVREAERSGKKLERRRKKAERKEQERRH
jgi:hypothetical protein